MRTRVSPSTGRRYPLTMICAGYRLARSSVYAARPHPTGAPAVRQARAEGGGERCRARRGHPGGACGVSVPRRGLPEGPGAPGASRPGRRGQARPPTDARSRAAGAPAPRPAQWQPGPRRDDYHRPARRDVGDGGHALLHGAGRLVLVLWGRPITGSTKSLGGTPPSAATAGPPSSRSARAFGTPSGALPRTSPGGSCCAVTGGRNTLPTHGSTR